MGNINRRDFLKVAGLSTASLALRRLDILTTQAPEKFHIDTPHADFYPFYENHLFEVPVSDISKVPELDLFFRELAAPTYVVHNKDPREYLIFEGTTLFNTPPMRTFPDSYLGYFRYKKIDVSAESMILPPNEAAFSVGIQGVETFSSIILFLEESIRLARNAKNKISPDQFLTQPLTTLSFLWAVSPHVTSGALLVDGTTNSNIEDRKLMDIHKFVHELHPEDIISYYRNIFMARKLQVLGKQVSIERNHHAVVAFTVGKAHSDIERLLSLDESQLIGGLDMYPDWLLKNTVVYNGQPEQTLEKQINQFCTVLSVPVREVFDGKIFYRAAYDQNLRDYLRKRLIP